MIEDIVLKKWAFWAINGTNISLCNERGDTIAKVLIGDLVEYVKDDMIAKRINIDKNGSLKY